MPSDVRRRINKPWTTVDRQLQALHMLEVLDFGEEQYGDQGKTRWLYSLAEDINPDALKAEKLPETSPVSADPTGRETADNTSSDDTFLSPFVGVAESGEDSGRTYTRCREQLGHGQIAAGIPLHPYCADDEEFNKYYGEVAS